MPITGNPDFDRLTHVIKFRMGLVLIAIEP
jgi:hypothetical protein